MGKKIIDFVMRRNASRGRKSKAGGGKIIKDHRTIYTPASVIDQTLPPKHRSFPHHGLLSSVAFIVAVR